MLNSYDFLTKYAQANSTLGIQSDSVVRDVFVSSIELIGSTFGKRAFRLQKALNAAVFESVMVGVSTRLSSQKPFAEGELELIYEKLLQNETYLAAVSKATAREDQVAIRIRCAIEAFQAE